MYRRIEVIYEGRCLHMPSDSMSEGGYKGGLMIGTSLEAFEYWGDMKCPSKDVYKNGRFFFTEKGWRLYGRPTVKHFNREGQRFRILTAKETLRSTKSSIIYKDDIQVVLREGKRKQ